MLPHSGILLATASYLLSRYGATARKSLPGDVGAVPFFSPIGLTPKTTVHAPTTFKILYAVSPIGTTFLSCITRIKFFGPRAGRAGSRSRMKGTINPVRAPE